MFKSGIGTKGLTERQKSAFFFEIKLTDKWRLFCDSIVELELEQILKDIFWDFGFDFTYRLNILGNDNRGYKIDLSLSFVADDYETMYKVVDFAFIGKKDGHGVDVGKLNSIQISIDTKHTTVDYSVRPSFTWGDVLRGWVDTPDSFKKILSVAYKKLLNNIAYRLLLVNGRAHRLECLVHYAESQAWEINEKGDLVLSK